MAFTAVFVFLAPFRSAGHGRKMPPAGRRRPHKRRNVRGEYRDKGGHVGGPGGHKKPAPGYPRAGNGDIQDFFAVSQITMIGRSRINRIIKRGTPPPSPYSAGHGCRRSIVGPYLPGIFPRFPVRKNRPPGCPC